MSVVQFQAGGALRDGSAYSVRPADSALIEALAAGQFCHVLAPRQMGKTSLCQRTRRLLAGRGWRTARVDLNQIGVSGFVDLRAWMWALQCAVAEELGVDPPAEPGLHDSPGAACIAWMRELVLDPRPVALFLDEIDMTRSVPFLMDDLFGALRALHDLRSEDPALARLTVCLIGVATPTELMRDVRRTPFNVSVDILLEDLSRDEARALELGFMSSPHPPEMWLDIVWGWTAGHPYQTQAICSAVVQALRAGRPGTRAMVDGLVHDRFLRPSGIEDTSLAQARRAIEQAPDPVSLLRLYRRVLHGEQIPLDRRETAQMDLLLAGVLSVNRASDPPLLQVRNRITAEVLDRAWVDRNLPQHATERACEDWYNRGCTDEHLLVGSRLEEAHRWYLAQESTTPRIRAYLDASTRLDQEHRRRQLLLRLLSVFMVILALAATSVAWSWVQTTRARVVELASAASRLANTPGQTTEALRSALQAFDWVGERGRSAATDSLVRTVEAVRGPSWKPGCGAVNAAAWDGSSVMLACGDGTLRRLDAASGETTRVLTGHSGPVYAIARLDDGTLASGGADATIRLWPPQGGAPLVLVGHGNEAIPADWTALDGAPYIAGVRIVEARGDRILSVAGDSSPRLWDSRGALVAVLVGHAGPVPFAAFSPDGAHVASGGMDGTVRVWSANGDPIHTWSTGGPIVHLAWSPDSRALLTAGERPVRVELGQAGVVGLAEGGAANPTVRAAWSEDSLILSQLYGPLGVWDPLTSRRTGELRGPSNGANDLRWTAGGHLVASLGDDALWAWHLAVPLWTSFTHMSTPRGVLPSPDGELLVSPGREGAVAVLRTVSPGATASISTPTRRVINRIQASPDGSVLFETEGPDIWRATPGLGAVAHVAPGETAGFLRDGSIAITQGRSTTLYDPSGAEVRARVDGWVEQTATAATDTRLVTLLGDAALLWSLPEARLIVRLPHPSEVLWVEISPDGQRIATAGQGGVVRIWAAEDGELLAVPQGHDPDETVNRLSWSPDSRLLATGSDDDDVRVWDGRTGAALLQLPVGGNAGPSFFLPDGERLATVARNRVVTIWDLRTGAELVQLRGHTMYLRDAALSRDGRQLATIGDDSTLRLWDMEEGMALGSWTATEGVVRALVFDPRTGDVIIGGDDGVLRMFPSNTDTIVALACSWLPADEAQAVCTARRRR